VWSVCGTRDTVLPQSPGTQWIPPVVAASSREFVDALQAAYADTYDVEEEENDAPDRVDDGGALETFDDVGSMSQMAANLLPR
jgi:hypothetical protein